MSSQSSARYEGVSPRSDLKSNIASLKTTRCFTGNQCKRDRTGEMWSVAWCPSEVAPLRSGSIADAETSCPWYRKASRCTLRALSGVYTMMHVGLRRTCMPYMYHSVNIALHAVAPVASPVMGHWGTCPLDFQQFHFAVNLTVLCSLRDQLVQMSTTRSSFDQYCISHKTISHRAAAAEVRRECPMT